MHEIITLQLGQRANYLLTHFWNIQESYFTYSEGEESPVDHDVHFRPGVGADGTETYTPRTLIYDLKGAFGTLRKHNALYELSEDLLPGQGLWDGKEVVQQQTQIPQSEYQRNLDEGLPAPQLSPETVRYWSDFNRVFYHPRSVIQLNDYELNSRTTPFEDWDAGEEFFNDLDKEHDLLDRDVRPFAEECDQLRALQVFTGSDDAWGGFAAKYIDRLRDEYGRKSIWTWGLEDGAKVPMRNQIKRDLNKARSVHHISSQSSLYTPIIDPPSRIPSIFSVDRQSKWHTSGLIGSALETVTLPSRLRACHDFEAALTGDGTHRIFELQSKIVQNGFDKRQDESRNTENEPSNVEAEFDLDFSYDSLGHENSRIFNQVQVARGSNSNQMDNSASAEDVGLLRRERLYNSKPMAQRWHFRDSTLLYCADWVSMSSFHTPLQFPLLDSFPRDMLPGSRADEGVNVLATLTSSSRTSDALRGFEQVARRMIGIDEREALVNGLGELRESYEIAQRSESDSDDD